MLCPAQKAAFYFANLLEGRRKSRLDEVNSLWVANLQFNDWLQGGKWSHVSRAT